VLQKSHKGENRSNLTQVARLPANQGKGRGKAKRLNLGQN